MYPYFEYRTLMQRHYGLLVYSEDKGMKQNRCVFPDLFSLPMLYSVVFYLAINY